MGQLEALWLLLEHLPSGSFQILLAKPQGGKAVIPAPSLESTCTQLLFALCPEGIKYIKEGTKFPTAASEEFWLLEAPGECCWDRCWCQAAGRTFPPVLLGYFQHQSPP